MVADLVRFLNLPDEGYWIVKHSNSNQGNGVEMCANVGKYKQDLVTLKDKWADEEPTPDTETHEDPKCHRSPLRTATVAINANFVASYITQLRLHTLRHRQCHLASNRGIKTHLLPKLLYSTFWLVFMFSGLGFQISCFRV